jgi:predicted dinucleotide-binding enzyme
MKIGVIGTGNIGGTLARKLSAASGSRDPEGLV